MLAIEIDQVNWESHEEGVYRLTGNDPHTLPRCENFPSKETFGTLRAGACDLCFVGNLCIARDVANAHPIGR